VPRRDAIDAFAAAEQATAEATAVILTTTAIAAGVLLAITVLMSVAVAYAISVPMVNLRNVVVRVASSRIAGRVPVFRAVTLEMARLAAVMTSMYSEVNAANSAASKGKTRSALDKLARVALLFERLGNSRGQGVCRNNRGAISLTLGSVGEAVGDLRAAVEQAQDDAELYFGRLARDHMASRGLPVPRDDDLAVGTRRLPRAGSRSRARARHSSSAYLRAVSPSSAGKGGSAAVAFPAIREAFTPGLVVRRRSTARSLPVAEPRASDASSRDSVWGLELQAPQWHELGSRTRLDSYSLALQEARRRENLGRALLTLGRRQDLAEAATCLEEALVLVDWLLSVEPQGDLDTAEPPSFPPRLSRTGSGGRDGGAVEGGAACAGGGSAGCGVDPTAVLRFRQRRVHASILLGRLRLCCLASRACARSARAAGDVGDERVARHALLSSQKWLTRARDALVAVADLLVPARLDLRVPSVWGSLETPECAALRLAMARASVLRAMALPRKAAAVLESAIVTAPIVQPAVTHDAALLLASILRQDLECFDASAMVSSVPHARDVLFLVDRSGSMAGSLGARALSLVRQVAVETVTPSDRVSLFTFAEGVMCDLPLTVRGTGGAGTGLDTLCSTVQSLPTPVGGSNCFEAVNTVVELVGNGFTSSGHRSPSKRQPVIIVITDGADNRGDAEGSIRMPQLERTAREWRLAVIVGLLGGADRHVQLEAVARASRLGAFLSSPTAATLSDAVLNATIDTHGPDTLLEAY
jgi:hypothetical protein